jgi:YHS domain-containing protein
MKTFTLMLLMTVSLSLAALGCGDKAQPAPAPVAKAEAAAPPSVFDLPQAEGTKATCPVMGNELTIGKDTQFSEYKGKYVYFCCPGCKPAFDADPEKYLGKAAPAPAK